jgi:hypothetical protein
MGFATDRIAASRILITIHQYLLAAIVFFL